MGKKAKGKVARTDPFKVECAHLNKMVDGAAKICKLRLAAKARQGWSGWDDRKLFDDKALEARACRAFIRAMSRDADGIDVVDAINFLFMRHQRVLLPRC